jgi:hypothetical protein
MLSVAAAYAQHINPKTQITWPTCTGGAIFYDIVHNTCVAGASGSASVHTPAGSVQIANSDVSGLDSDPNITIDPVSHTFRVGGAITGNRATIATLSTPPASWTLDMTSPATARASLGVSSGASPPFPLTDLAVQAANTVVMNNTTGSAGPTAVGLPDCTGGTNYNHLAGWTCTSATNTTCNSNGCYTIAADGTKHAWGESSVVVGSPNSAVVTGTYPTTFTTTPIPSLTPVAAPAGGGGACSGFSCPVTCNAVRTSLSTTGFNAGISWATVSGSGFSNLSTGDYCHYDVWGR